MILSRPLFTVSSHHADDDPPPPSFDGDEPGTYHSYFENAHGEQSVFVCRRETGEALLYSGDAGWAAFPVVGGQVQGLVLSPDEALWVRACLQAIA
jgi:hypothetical protein